MQLPTSKRVIQNAWVVNNIEQAAHSWSRSLGIGPFFVGTYPSSVFEDLRYRGAPGQLTMRTAIAYSGDLQIELIEPLGDAPNAYRDMFPAGRTGFHHICLWSDDLEADLAHYRRQGAAIVNVGRVQGGPGFAYVDTRSQFGCMTELLETNAGLAELFASWKSQSLRWDGRDPIVSL